MKDRAEQTWVEVIAGAMDRLFESFYHSVLAVYKVSQFTHSSIKKIWEKPYRYTEFIQHMHFIANESLMIIALTGVFTGMAVSFQIYLGFKLVNATALVGPTVALGITRELAPVLTGLIVAARAGGAMAARLGTMRVTEQIDALEVMGIHPKQYLVAPRILAAVISLPLLCGFFDFLALLGSYFLCVHVLGLDPGIFFGKIQEWIQPSDIFQGLFKSAVFGFIFAAICTCRGYYTTNGAKGVGEATNTGVVYSMVLIIAVNFVIANFIRFFLDMTG